MTNFTDSEEIDPFDVALDVVYALKRYVRANHLPFLQFVDMDEWVAFVIPN